MANLTRGHCLWKNVKINQKSSLLTFTGRGLLLISPSWRCRGNKIFTEAVLSRRAIHSLLYNLKHPQQLVWQQTNNNETETERKKGREVTERKSSGCQVLSHEIISRPCSLQVIPATDTVSPTTCGRHFWKTAEIINLPPRLGQEREVLHTSLHPFASYRSRSRAGVQHIGERMLLNVSLGSIKSYSQKKNRRTSLVEGTTSQRSAMVYTHIWLQLIDCYSEVSGWVAMNAHTHISK